MTLPLALQNKPKRILIKLSGEVLMGDEGYGLDPKVLGRISQDIKDVKDAGYEVCLVIGGGNIFRGVDGARNGIERSTSDYMGMLATVMNALAVQSALENIGVVTRVMSAIRMQTICEPMIRRRAMRHLEKDRVVIFAAGTGSPYFTTDTAATLRASEMDCDILMKATKVDGIYCSDPVKNKDAKFLPTVSFNDALTKDLKVMDASAVALARENRLPILVFSILKPGNILKTLKGESQFTIVDKSENL